VGSGGKTCPEGCSQNKEGEKTCNKPISLKWEYCRVAFRRGVQIELMVRGQSGGLGVVIILYSWRHFFPINSLALCRK
jgi:hypothetical protein